VSPDGATSDQHHVSATMHTKQQALAGTTGSLLQWMQQSRSASSGHGSVDNELGRASSRGASSVAPYACVGDYAPAELVPGMRKGRNTSSQVSSKATVTCLAEAQDLHGMLSVFNNVGTSMAAWREHVLTLACCSTVQILKHFVACRHQAGSVSAAFHTPRWRTCAPLPMQGATGPLQRAQAGAYGRNLSEMQPTTRRHKRLACQPCILLILRAFATAQHNLLAWDRASPGMFPTPS
jgi:hypothetical protein